jgi:ABC-type Mn2+/Zn2+ transport system ATPase subunit
MQRALLCRALISDPKVLILDEPTTYVDQTFEAELYTLLRRLNSDTLDSPDTSGTPATPNAFGTPGKAIVIVSHDTTTLAPLAKRIIHIA